MLRALVFRTTHDLIRITLLLTMFAWSTNVFAQSTRGPTEWLRDYSWLKVDEFGCAKSDPKKDGKNDAKAFVGLVQAVSELAQREKRFKGKIETSFTSTDVDTGLDTSRVQITSAQNRSEVKAKIKLGRGVYPDEVSLQTEVSATIQRKAFTEKNTFTEKVSSLHLSYDRYPHPWLEGYVFLDRFTSDYLSIDERYEVGGGLVFEIADIFASAIRTDVPVTKEGKEELRKLLETTTEADQHNVYGHEKDTAKRATWIDCYVERLVEGIEEPAKTKLSRELTKQVEKDLEELGKIVKDVAQSTRRRYPLVRIAFLVGVFGELENATLILESDTLVLDAQRQIKFEIRPTIEFRIRDELFARADWYLKWGRRKSESKGFDDLRRNIRSDLRTTLSWTVRPKVSINFNFRYLYDSEPPFFAPDADEANLAIAQKKKVEAGMSVTLEF